MKAQTEQPPSVIANRMKWRIVGVSNFSLRRIEEEYRTLQTQLATRNGDAIDTAQDNFYNEVALALRSAGLLHF